MAIRIGGVLSCLGLVWFGGFCVAFSFVYVESVTHTTMQSIFPISIYGQAFGVHSLCLFSLCFCHVPNKKRFITKIIKPNKSL